MRGSAPELIVSTLPTGSDPLSAVISVCRVPTVRSRSWIAAASGVVGSSFRKCARTASNSRLAEWNASSRFVFGQRRGNHSRTHSLLGSRKVATDTPREIQATISEVSGILGIYLPDVVNVKREREKERRTSSTGLLSVGERLW